MRPALRRRRRSAGGGADAKIQKEKKKSQVKPAVPDRNGTVIRLISGLFAIEELLTEQFNEASAKVTAATDRERSLLAELSEARRQSTDSAMRLVDIAQVHHGELALLRAQLEEANARAHRHELRAQQLEGKPAS